MKVLGSILLIFTLLTSHAFARRTPSPDAARNNVSSADELYLPTEDKAAQLYVHEIGHGEPAVVLHSGYRAEYSYLLDAVRGLENKNQVIFTEEMLEFQPQEFIAEGDKVVVLGHGRWRAKSTGQTAESDWVHVFTRRNGKTVSFREYSDTAAALKSFTTQQFTAAAR